MQTPPPETSEVAGHAPSIDAPLIEMVDIRKSYNIGQPNEAEVLHGVSLTMARGEFVALIGPSGSGKSTLLNIIGLLEQPTKGSYRVQGQETVALADAERTALRGRALGFVFQFHHLLPAFTALENVTLPALMREGWVSPAQQTVSPCFCPTWGSALTRVRTRSRLPSSKPELAGRWLSLGKARRNSQVSNRYMNHTGQCVGHNGPVAHRVIAFEAQEAAVPVGHQGRGQGQVNLSHLRRHVGGEDGAEPGIIARPGRLPTRLRVAEPLEVDVLDTRLRQGGRQRPLGKPLPAGDGERTDVDHTGNAGGLEGRHEVGKVGSLVADGE